MLPGGEPDLSVGAVGPCRPRCAGCHGNTTLTACGDSAAGRGRRDHRRLGSQESLLFSGQFLLSGTWLVLSDVGSLAGRVKSAGVRCEHRSWSETRGMRTTCSHRQVHNSQQRALSVAAHIVAWPSEVRVRLGSQFRSDSADATTAVHASARCSTSS